MRPYSNHHGTFSTLFCVVIRDSDVRICVYYFIHEISLFEFCFTFMSRWRRHDHPATGAAQTGVQSDSEEPTRLEDDAPCTGGIQMSTLYYLCLCERAGVWVNQRVCIAPSFGHLVCWGCGSAGPVSVLADTHACVVANLRYKSTSSPPSPRHGALGPCCHPLPTNIGPPNPPLSRKEGFFRSHLWS